MFFSANWENALRYFRRALLECGNSLSIEHSQRLGLLFSRKTGNTGELKRWASLFDAEEVPTTALILNALVSHDQWKVAIALFDLNKDCASAAELSEYLGRCLISKGLWQQTLQIADCLFQKEATHSEQSTKQPIQSSSSPPYNLEDDDSYQMALNPSFVPAEEKKGYCGFVSAAARAYPRNQQWVEAVALLQKMQKVADANTKSKLVEYEVKRLVHGGKKYKEAIERSRREEYFHKSPSLLRSVLRAALAIGDTKLALVYLDLLCSCGEDAISVPLFENSCRAIVSSEDTYSRTELLRFETVICREAAFVKDIKLQKLIAVFCADNELKIPILNRDCMLSSKGTDTPKARTASITSLDRLASALMAQKRWEDALNVAKRMLEHTAQEKNECVIQDMLISCRNSWEKTLQFFTS